MGVSRRLVLSGLIGGIAGLAGCQTPVEEHLSVINQSSGTITATITVVRLSDQRELLEDTFTLPVHDPDDPAIRAYDDVVGPDRVRVHLAVENGPEAAHEYIDPNESDTDDVTIVVHDDHIEFNPDTTSL